MRISHWLHIWRNMGSRYMFFRFQFALRTKLGLLRWQFPLKFTEAVYPSKSEWFKKRGRFFFDSSTDFASILITDNYRSKAMKILNGEIPFFSRQWMNLGSGKDWTTHPITGYKYSIQQHWSDVKDLDSEAGDIKYIWEKSRFSFIYPVIILDASDKTNHSDWFFHLIDDWIAHNPFNCGPNYKCSQEISLRVLNWIFALYFYGHLANLTEKRWQVYIQHIHAQITHVYDNINFSRIAVRNNHALTETLTLYIVGTLFPFLPDAMRWRNKGKKWFEQEIAYQIYSDGTFLQYSHNYHRVVIQLLSWAIIIADRNGDKWSDTLYSRAVLSVNYLYQCQIMDNGYLPNYGANDGALFFPFSDTEYRDYRPQLNALWYALSGKKLYPKSQCGLDYQILGTLNKHIEEKKITKSNVSCFPDGGIYVIRDGETLTLVKCASYKNRPSQADNFHLDIWVGTENIIMDTGSYQYNTDSNTLDYFVGNRGHNTIAIGEHNSMQKIDRFIWLHWIKKAKGIVLVDTNTFVIKVEMEAFSQVGKPVKVTRVIKKTKDALIWEVTDEIERHSFVQDLPFYQYWHPSSNKNIQIKVRDDKGNYIQSEILSGYYSDYYGVKTNADYLRFSTKSNHINTIIRL